jgi:hypothetical protein
LLALAQSHCIPGGKQLCVVLAVLEHELMRLVVRILWREARCNPVKLCSSGSQTGKGCGSARC